MSSNSEGTGVWVKAVKLKEDGNSLYLTLEHMCAAGSMAPTYQLTVVEPYQSRAWSSNVSYQEICDGVLQQHMTMLKPEEVDRGLQLAVSGSALQLECSGLGGSQLSITAMYHRVNLAPVPLRLPAQGMMEAQHGEDFSRLNSRVLDILMQQNMQLQAETSLLLLKLQQLQQHTQRVHNSYNDAVDSIAANLTREQGHLPGRTTQNVLTASPLSTGKRQKLEHVAASPSATLAGELHSSPGLQSGFTLQQPPTLGSLLPFSQDHGGGTLAPTVTAAAAPLAEGGKHSTRATGAGAGGSANTTTPPSKQRATKKGGYKRQLSAEDKLKQRIVLAQQRLEEEWGGLQQLLGTDDAAAAEQLLVNRLPCQNRTGPVGGSAPVQPPGQPSLVVPDSQAGVGTVDNNTLQAAARHHNGTGLQQLSVKADVDADSAGAAAAAAELGVGGEEESQPVVVVHKSRGRSKAVGGALGGRRKK